MRIGRLRIGLELYGFLYGFLVGYFVFPAFLALLAAVIVYAGGYPG